VYAIAKMLWYNRRNKNISMEQNNIEQKNKTVTVVVEIMASLIFIGVVIGVWRLMDRATVIPPPSVSSVPVPETAGGLGADISASVANPTADQVPETNPFKQETNPLKGAYQNPFE
jgi:hypothetical protein